MCVSHCLRNIARQFAFSVSLSYLRIFWKRKCSLRSSILHDWEQSSITVVNSVQYELGVTCFFSGLIAAESCTNRHSFMRNQMIQLAFGRIDRGDSFVLGYQLRAWGREFVLCCLN